MAILFKDIPTGEIKLGDVIYSHGMRLLVDTEPKVSKAHPAGDDERGDVKYVAALIENWDAMVEKAKEDTYVTGFIVNMVRNDIRDGRITEPRWTIQGNNLARWTREVVE